MNVLSRRLGLLVAATGAVLSLIAVPAPAASAATPPGPVPAAPAGAFAPGVPAVVPAVTFGRWSCRPVHTGPNWRWDEMRRGSHWDHREWNPRTRRVEWRRYWRDDRYCTWVRVDGPPPGRGAGPVGNGPGRNGPGNGPVVNGPGNGPLVNGPAVNGPVVNAPAGTGPVGTGPVGNQPPPRRF